MVSTDDAPLVEKAKKGNQDALVALYERYQPSIYTYLFYRVGDQTVAEDLTADVFVRMVDKLYTYETRGKPLLAWLYTIAHHLLVDYRRQVGKESWLPLEESLEQMSEQNTQKMVEQRLTVEKLQTALCRLTEDQQKVILLRFVEGLSCADVSQRIGKPEGAVKALQHRALAALRRILQQEQLHESGL